MIYVLGDLLSMSMENGLDGWVIGVREINEVVIKMFQVRGEGSLIQGRSFGDGKGQKMQKLNWWSLVDDCMWEQRVWVGWDIVFVFLVRVDMGKMFLIFVVGVFKEMCLKRSKQMFLRVFSKLNGLCLISKVSCILKVFLFKM